MTKKILFIGDSITWMYRPETGKHNLGIGYPTLVAANLGMDRPGEFEFVNTGISGNRSIDILARVKCDIINHAPDYLSILVGVNDAWGEFWNHAPRNGINAQRYETYYRMLLEEVREALPNTKIMILEPFVLKGYGTETKWTQIRQQIVLRAEAAQRVAKEAGALFVPLQDTFDRAAQAAAPDYWLYDGVHPTPMGHEVIKREWLKAFSDLEQAE